MAQDEIILNIPSEENKATNPNDHYEAATNLNLVSSQVVKTKNIKPRKDRAASPSRGQTHSRESSGASNLSVKFTIEREGIGGASPTVTESVSVCSTPQHISPNPNLEVTSTFSKPLPTPSTKSNTRRRRSRKSFGSSGHDSGALSGSNSQNEEYNEGLSEDGSLQDDEGTTMDESSDEASGRHLCHVNELDTEHAERRGSQQRSTSRSPNDKNKTTVIVNTNKCTTNIKGDPARNDLATSPLAEMSTVDSREYSSGTTRRILLTGVLKGQNEYTSFHNSQNDPDVLDGIPPQGGGYFRTLSSVVATPSSGAGGADRRGHRRNISDTHQPLISDNCSPSDSSCSEDDAGANTSGYTRRKARTHRTTFADHFSSRSGGAGDGIGLNHSCSSRHRGSGVGAHVIDIDGRVGDGLDSDDEDHIPGEPLKTFIAFVFLFFAWVATTTSLALTHDRVPNVDPLPDIFLDNVTYQHWGLDASEIIIMISTWTAFIITLFHKHRFIVLRRIFLMIGVHYYYRSITMFLTVLPVADTNYLKDTCMKPSNQTTPLIVAQRVLKLLSGMGLSINGKHVYCGDYIYSGHTMSLIMGFLVIKQYSPRGWFLLHYASMITSIAGVVTLLLARGHYSIDVVIAYWITTRIWWMYHTLANNANLKEVDGFGENPDNFLKKMWWWYIFRYFECNVPVCLPREFGWPVPMALVRSKPVQYVIEKLRRCTRRRPSTSEAATGNGDSNLPTSSTQNNSANSGTRTISA